MTRLPLLLLPFSLLLIGAAQPAATDPNASARIRAHIEFLASDLLEGRDTGSRGYEIAASYVASQFRGLGLKPGGTDGSWYMPVPFRRATHAAVPAVALRGRGQPLTLVHGTDVVVRPSVTQRGRRIDAPLVFVGYGLVDPAMKLNDYAGLNVRGKIVVALDGTPRGLPSDVAAHLGSTKDDAAAERGAVGFIELPSAGPARPAGLAAAASRPTVDWVDAEGRSGAGAAARVIRISVSPQWAEQLFVAAPRGLGQVRADAAASRRVRGFPLRPRMSVQSRSQWTAFTSPQVVAVLPGADRKLAGEHVVLMGHLDHIGVKADAKPGEDAINNGALDNASGIATMLEAARHFVQSGETPRRSVMFVANTGEEKGLLGADYFAAHPPVPLRSMVGLVNLDMPLLLYPFRDVIAFGAEHSTVAKAVAQAGGQMGVAVAADPMPEESLFVRSDHYPMVRRGVPSVFLMTGYANGGEAKWKSFLHGNYHSPRDDLSQPIDWEAAGRFAELNYRIARTLADADQRPRWYRGSYFGDTFARGQAKAAR